MMTSQIHQHNLTFIGFAGVDVCHKLSSIW